jgi:hypothetical protein
MRLQLINPSLPHPQVMEDAIQELMPQIDLLVVWGTMGGLAAKKLVRTLPVIFVAVAAPNLALTYGLPSCYAFRETVQAGGLVSLGPNPVWMAKQAAGYVDKIIRGPNQRNCQCPR